MIQPIRKPSSGDTDTKYVKEGNINPLKMKHICFI
jgi:hypothetical protein